MPLPILTPSDPDDQDDQDIRDRLLLTGMLVGKLLGAGITAYVQVDESGNYTDYIQIILHDQPYEPIKVTVQVVSPTED